MAMTALQEAQEAKAREACERGDYDAAATHLIEAYGAELLRFLASRMSDQGAAAEVYSEVAERLWRALPRFQWRHGARAWCYAIARNTSINYVTAAGRRPERNLPLSQAAQLSQMVERTRSRTMPFLRTEVKDRFRRLREQLSDDDQTLMTLRLDRRMEWRELALVMSFDGEEPSDEQLKRESARLRKRFEAAKDKLRRFAREAGLLPEPE
jgi:RNA polymerase sigma-70 factor (ECF subfamily)